MYTWGLFNQFININDIAKSGHTLCWSAKWLGEKGLIYSGLNIDDNEIMLKKMHSLLDEADAVITYNGNRYDLPTLNKEFIKIGLKPPAPYKKIDLLQVAKSKFRFVSNKLDYVAQFLGLGHKVRHGRGNELFVQCAQGDAKAWKLMERYNKQDVILLEKVYHKMLPWITNHPNRSVNSEDLCCPNCGGKKFEKRGTVTTAAGKYQRYQCKAVACGHWFRDNTNLIARRLKGHSVP